MTRLPIGGLCLIFLFCCSLVIAAPGQSIFFTNVANFSGTDGANPYAGLVQGRDGNLYGTTWVGGNPNCNGGYGCGTVFKITPAGTITTLHSFCSEPSCTDGSFPLAPLILATHGNFYGTTTSVPACGTVFKITPDGTLTTMHTFDYYDGCYTWAGLLEASDGNFYGTTSQGGSNGVGTVFKMTPTGTLTTLHSFNGFDGNGPYASLVQGTDGNFYGTTVIGGTHRQCEYGYGCGTVFKISPTGEFSPLHSFDGTDGASPYGWLVSDGAGSFYGTTCAGGPGNGGTVFRITPTGELTTFSAGDCPTAGLVQGRDGNFYGTTGGANSSYGTVFQITPSGELTTLHSFDGTDGSTPWGGLVQASDGSFYGTTYSGGPYDSDGTVFRAGVASNCVTCSR